MKKLYAIVRGGVGGHVPNQNGWVVTFVHFKGPDNRIGKAVLQAHLSKTSHGVQNILQRHQLANGDGAYLVVVRSASTAILRHCTTPTPSPRTIFPSSFAGTWSAGMYACDVLALDASDGATSFVNEDESPQGSPKPVSNPATPTGDEDVDRKCPNDVVLVATDGD